MTLDSRRPVLSMVVLLSLGTTLRSLPLVMRRRWTEAPEALAIALCNSSPFESRLTVMVLGSFLMGFPSLLLAAVNTVISPGARVQAKSYGYIPRGSTASVIWDAIVN